MKEIYIIKKTITTPDNRVLVICDVTVNDTLSHIDIKSYPLDMNGILDVGDTDDMISDMELFAASITGHHRLIEFRDAIITNNTGNNQDYKIAILGFEGGSDILVDQNHIMLYILDHRLKVIRDTFVYTLNKPHIDYKMSECFNPDGITINVKFSSDASLFGSEWKVEFIN